jgi:hypothetical protein
MQKLNFKGQEVIDMRSRVDFLRLKNNVRTSYDINLEYVIKFIDDLNIEDEEKKLIKFFIKHTFDNAIDASVDEIDPVIKIEIDTDFIDSQTGNRYISVIMKNNGSKFSDSKFLKVDLENNLELEWGNPSISNKLERSDQYGGQGQGLALTRQYLSQNYGVEFFYGDNIDESIVGIKIPKQHLI